jgi:hypothetical protein
MQQQQQQRVRLILRVWMPRSMAHLMNKMATTAAAAVAL